MPAQAVEIPLLGAMDGDTPSETFVKGTHRSATNVIFRGNKGNMRGENMPGTRLVNNTLPAGTNLCIGRYYDSVGSRIIFFNYNSNGTHGIYAFNYITETFQTILINGVGTQGDVLGFTATTTIHSINIIYQDSNAGDILTFVDSLGRPSKLNIPRYISNTYALVKRSYIDVAKAPPQMPPKVCYENDANVTINNLRNSLFQFKYRFVYDDNEKSVWSSASIIPLPDQPSIQLTNSTDFTLNSRISLNFSTGDVDTVKIELAGRQVKDGATTDWFLIESLNKSLLSINNNDVYTYRFYNDGLYPFLDINDSLLLFDYVPQAANCQELLNGSVLSYGGITEGYNPISSNITVTQSTLSNYKFYDINGLLFYAVINGLDSGSIGTTMKVYLYGTGSNDINGFPTSLTNSNANFVINAIDSGGVARGGNYQTSANLNNVSTILSGVSASLVLNGWTQSSLVGNVLTMTYPSNITLLSSGTQNNLSNSNNGEVSYAYPFNSAYKVGVVYFDAKGRTNGVITNKSAIFNTTGYPVGVSQGYPLPVVNISHRPPTWASYYQIVRTANLTYSKLLYWITKECYSDPATSTATDQFAYLSIDNIAFYNAQSSATQGVINYGFNPGDRIKIIMRFNASGAGTQISYDYEVVGIATNPIAGGVARYGNFLKIYYPTNDIGANLKFDGTADYLNYEIVIYNYAKHNVNGTNTFFEFGKCFGIGNAGTSNAYHIGLDQTQSANLATPALITIANGDYFYRFRNVPVGGTYVLSSVAFNNGFQYISPGLSIATNTVTPNYTVQTSTPQYSHSLAPGDYTPSAAFFLNTASFGIKIRLRTTIPVIVDGPTSTSVLIQAINSDGTFQLITIYQPQSMINGQSYSITIDSTFVVQANAHLHLLIQNSSEVINQHVYPFYLTLDVLSSINIPVIDSSFSDVYKLVENADNRANLVDPNARQTYFTTLFRYSRPYQLGTNINETNKFYPLNFDEFKRDYGDIRRMIQQGKQLNVFQHRRVGETGIYQKFIKNNQGERQLVVSDTIITQNNIEYYEGDYGIANQPDCIAHDGYRFYFTDPIKGYVLRKSVDGIEPISEVFKQQTWAGNNVSKFVNSYPYQYGGNAKILGCFNFKKDKQGEYICVLQDGTGFTGSTISFDEQNKFFTSFYSFKPDAILCVENKLVSWVGGQLYIHDDTVNMNKFYGTSYPSSLEIILTDGLASKKDFAYMGYVSPLNSIWNAPNSGDVSTSYGNISSLQNNDFENREGVWHAAFLRDGNSPGGEINGDYLKGQWVDVKLQNNSTFLTYIYGIFLSFLNSPKNF